jgi:hypothetical protein
MRCWRINHFVFSGDYREQRDQRGMLILSYKWDHPMPMKPSWHVEHRWHSISVMFSQYPLPHLDTQFVCVSERVFPVHLCQLAMSFFCVLGHTLHSRQQFGL